MIEGLTFEKLKQLPENGGFEMKEEMRDGKKVRVPYMRPAFALGDVGMVADENGLVWIVGKANGIYYKSRFGVA